MTFHIQMTDSLMPESHASIAGKIIDISPHGMKMLYDLKLQRHLVKSTKVEIHFVIDTHMIEAHGEIKWSKIFGNLCELGILFHDGHSLEEMIISELKLRRKKEVLGEKEPFAMSKAKERQAFRNKNR